MLQKFKCAKLFMLQAFFMTARYLYNVHFYSSNSIMPIIDNVDPLIEIANSSPMRSSGTSDLLLCNYHYFSLLKHHINLLSSYQLY